MDFTKNNIALSPLYSIKYPMQIFHLPNEKLPLHIFKEAQILYEALFGEEFSNEDFTITLKSDEFGDLQKIYGPSVGSYEDQLAIKWGEKVFVLEIEKGSIKAPEVPEDFKLKTFDINEANFGYQNNEVCLTILLETPDEYINLNIPLRFQDPKTAPRYSEYLTMIKKNLSGAASLLYEVQEGKSSGGMGSSQNILKLQDLEQGTKLVLKYYDVIEYIAKNGEETKKFLIVDKDSNKYWAPAIVEHMLTLLSYDAETKPTLEIIEISESSNQKKFVNLGVIRDEKYEIYFGGSIKAAPEKILDEGVYTVVGYESFKSPRNSFTTYIYTIISEDGVVSSCFAPSKHRNVLNARPVINASQIATFEIYSSGKDGGNFKVSALSAHFEEDNETFIDVSNMF